jgi:hypothetical protein
MVPWMREWMNRSKDSSRNAFVESVARVKGRNSSICRTVESLYSEIGEFKNGEANRFTYFAALKTVLQSNHELEVILCSPYR